MPLIKYSQYLTYPDGNPASGIVRSVCWLGGSRPIPLFSDKAGTTPLANPVTADVEGLVEFYAAPGCYVTELAGEMFHYFVDAAETDDAWPGTFVHEQVTPSTTWTIHHAFDCPPEVTVLVAGVRVEATVEHPDDQHTTLTFNPAQAGTAYLRR